MESKTAVTALAALAQTSRLAVFRYLVQAGPEGLSAGKIAELAAIAPSSLSFHLKELAHAGLVRSRQEGRFVIYASNFAAMNELLDYLTANCCGGAPCDECPPSNSTNAATNAATDDSTGTATDLPSNVPTPAAAEPV